ncbi:uncharacterized protein LOC100378270 [Saccoglossus kowalevskii]|uniref:Zinc finger CCHC domain-containing protein 14-like n=1 Tax=Saccoglossus kowalevskii TaxID=10224 RepID=A0ABM0MBE9_SACKO|nr:PREDICTED: zinc finger CCHC domain-containing protein 14-like [Saccoglossus kowalevskii]
MVYKEEVYEWFGRLNGSSRMDFICGLLDLCLPLELRFLGACIEDLARRDYTHLRDAEIRANNKSEIEQLTDISNQIIRSKLIVSMALLYSSNRKCSEIIFKTLSQNMDTIFNNINTEPGNEVYDEFLLLLTMASFHPALIFRQKEFLKSQLDRLPKIPSPQEHRRSKECCNITEKSLERQESASPSPIQSQEPTLAAVSSQVIPQKVYITNIEVEGLNKRSSDKRYEYIFKVTCSNGSVNTVCRTHGELFAFQCKLLNQFESDTGSQQSDCNMPYLPGKHSCRITHKGELAEKGLPEIKDYARRLVTLPQHILQWDDMLNFFQCPVSSTVGGAAVANAKPVHEDSEITFLGPSSLSPEPSVAPVTTCSTLAGPAINKVSSNTSNGRPTFTQGQPPLPVSPLPSPLSSHIPPAPTALPLTRPPLPGAWVPPASPPVNLSTEPHFMCVQKWLKDLRLHKYYPFFKDLTMEQILQLREEDLESWKITTGAKNKLLSNLKKLRIQAKGFNGIIPQASVMYMSPTNHPTTYLASSATHTAPIQSLFYMSQHICTSECSCSDCSSSPSSPRESSDENEKDSEASESSLVSLPDSNPPIKKVLTTSVATQHGSEPINRDFAQNVANRINRSCAATPSYSNVVKSLSMERIDSRSPIVPVSHSHSTPSSPASETTIRQPRQMSLPLPPPGSYYPPMNPNLDAASPLRSTAMVFTPKLPTQEEAAVPPTGPYPREAIVPQQINIPVKSTGSAVNNPNIEAAKYKTSVVLVPSASASTAIAMMPPSSVMSMPAAMSTTVVTPAVVHPAFSSVPVCNATQMDPINVNPAPIVAQSKVTCSSPRGGGEGLRTTPPLLPPPPPHVLNTPAQPPSNTFGNEQQNIMYNNNMPPNYVNNSQGTNFPSNNSTNFPVATSGTTFANTRGSVICNTTNSMVCTTCGHSCSGNNPMTNNSSSLPFSFNTAYLPPGFMNNAMHYPNLLQANLSNLVATNGYVNPAIQTTPRYQTTPLQQHSAYPNGVGEFLYGHGSHYGMMGHGAPQFVSPGLIAQHGSNHHHMVGHKKHLPVQPVCYNCGAVGHRSSDCKETSLESHQNQFRLKYAPVSEQSDNSEQ